MMFDALRMDGFDQAALTERVITWENVWVASTEPVARRIPADPLGDAERLLASLP